MGHIIPSVSLGADPNKLKAINEMPPPPDKASVQRVLGTENYVPKFTLNLADLAKSMRELVKKENEFVWEEGVYGKYLEQVKQVLTQAPVLKFFDPRKKRCFNEMPPWVVWRPICYKRGTDPVVYASRAPTPTETNYAQIEKESL